MRAFLVIALLAVLYLIGPIALYRTGGPLWWYIGIIVLTVILAYLIHLREPAKNLLHAVSAGLISPLIALTHFVFFAGILVSAFLAGLFFKLAWQGLLFGWLVAGVIVMARGLWNAYKPQRKAKPAT